MAEDREGRPKAADRRNGRGASKWLLIGGAVVVVVVLATWTIGGFGDPVEPGLGVADDGPAQAGTALDALEEAESE